MSILVLGTVALDSVKTPFGFRRNILGGSAAHFSMSARLFTPVNLVAVVGQDFPGKHIKFLEEKGLILTSLNRDKGKTFRWEGKYEGDLNSALTLNTELGVLSTFQPTVSAKQKKIKYIFLANVDPDIQRHLLGHIHSPRLIGLDSMNYWIHHKRKELLRALKLIDIYVANDQEARSLSGETNLLKSARYLRSLGPKMILIKKGEHGVLFYSDKFIFSLPAYPTDKVIDPTGAGDTFAGGMVGHLSRCKKINDAEIRKSLVYGSIMASFAVEDFSVDKLARISRREIEARYRHFRSITRF